MTLGTGFPRGDANRVMSRTELKRFMRCPSRWLVGGVDEDTDSKDNGALIDCLALTPKQFPNQYAVTPPMYPCEPTKKDPRTEKPWNRNANFCSAWEEEQAAAGRIAITPAEETKARKAVNRLMDNPKIAEVMDGAAFQVPLVVDYADESTGLVIPIKCLIDIVPKSHPRYLADLKTTKDAHRSKWPKEVYNYWYDAQAALYLDAWNVCREDRRDVFLHLKQENFPPFETATQPLSEDFIIDGRKRYMAALELYCQCLFTNNWPDYDAPAPGTWSMDGFGPVCEPEPWMILHQL